MELVNRLFIIDFCGFCVDNQLHCFDMSSVGALLLPSSLQKRRWSMEGDCTDIRT
jgi:hypothetical protein